MVKLSMFSRRSILPLTVFLILIIIGLVQVYGETVTEKGRTDIVVIDLPAVPGGEQMHPVSFQHDRHVEALKGKDCATCHDRKDEKFVFKFKRLENSTPEADMNIYHDGCVSCHQETANSGLKSGPLSGDCRSCHSRKTNIASAWQAISFDRSLHYRHEVSKDIQKTDLQDGTNCGACHHKYDETAQKTVYKRGEEESCTYCHKNRAVDKTSSLRTASHDSCVNCHSGLKAKMISAGPINCNGCHDAAMQEKIKIIRDVPRLPRNQPDTVLLASWQAQSKQPQEDVKKHLAAVPFNHMAHEAQVPDCKSCHHASLKKCGDCHTEVGSKDGGFVQLAQAMHHATTDKSCVGCHAQATREKDCSGCHLAMPVKTFEDMRCEKCHQVNLAEGVVLPLAKDQMKTIADAALQNAAVAFNRVPQESIPETVQIDVLVDEYEAVSLPHRKIVNRLYELTQNNKMAQYFHADGQALCQGCHHKSPASLQPPACGSCHGTTGPSVDGRPALKAAYHGQCNTCHERMGIEEPAANDCIKCHKKKNG